jgi:hypothetical protein
VLAFPTPFVLMTLRGRVLLRVGLPIPRVDALVQALALFGVAVDRAARFSDPPAGAASVWPATTVSALSTPEIAQEQPKRGH